MDFSKIKGIVFDCDGVLINSKQANIKYYNLVLEMMNLPPLTIEQVEFVHSHTVQESIRHIVPPDKIQQALEVSKEIPYSQVLKYIELESGLIELLTLLKNMNICCAVNTNRNHSIELVLEYFNLDSFFYPVISASTVTWPKPHPESLFQILQVWSFSQQQVVFIGDTSVDQQAANAAYMDFWSYKNNTLQAEMHISDYWTLAKEIC